MSSAIDTLADSPGPRVGIGQDITLPVKLHSGVDAVSLYAVPVGTVSFSRIPVAVDGPLFVTLMR